MKKFEPSYAFRSRTEIAESIGVSKSTFWKMLKRYEIDLPKGLVNYANQILIYESIYGEKHQMIENK